MSGLETKISEDVLHILGNICFLKYFLLSSIILSKAVCEEREYVLENHAKISSWEVRIK